MGKTPSAPPDNHYYLPDFCNVRTVLYAVILGELLAFMLMLRPFEQQAGGWTELSLISLFIQWVTLTSSWLLCNSRRFVQHRSIEQITIWAAAIILGTTLLFSELAIWISWELGVTSTPPHGWHWQISLRNLAVAFIVTLAVLRYSYLQFQWQRQAQAETRARLDALQARIRPHFLFNSMNTIASLIRSQPEEAEAAVEDLADLFRHNLSDIATLVSLEQELEVTRRYIHMEQLRLGDRLTVDWQLTDSTVDIKVPALILQPLVENAIYHGIESLAAGGTVSISDQLQDNILAVTVSNPVDPRRAKQHQGNKIALDNIKHRLQALYGSQGRVDTEQSADRFSVTLSFPCNQGAS